MKARSAIIYILAASVLNAQTQSAFNVASIRQSKPGEGGGCAQYLPGGRLNVVGCPLTAIISQAYGLLYFQVVDAPKWADDGETSGFNIQAKAASDVGADQMKLMLRNLLADRFQLRYHLGSRPLSVFALVPAKGGLNLHAAKDNGKPRGSGFVELVDTRSLRGTNVRLSFLALALSKMVDRPVVDRTNFPDPVDFILQWSPDPNADSNHPSVFTAIQEQLGLKLDPQNLPMDVLIVDLLEKPSAN